MNISRDLKDLSDKCSEIKDEFDRSIAIASIITKVFEDNGQNAPVVIGGAAVALYTKGEYASHDMDMLTRSDMAKDLLKELGLSRKGRYFYHPTTTTYIDLPSGNLNGDSSMVFKYTVPFTNLPVYVIGLEDLILDRAGSYFATNSASCKEWAVKLMVAFYSSIDWSYLHSESNRRGILDKVERLQREVKGYRNIIKLSDEDLIKSKSSYNGVIDLLHYEDSHYFQSSEFKICCLIPSNLSEYEMFKISDILNIKVVDTPEYRQTTLEEFESKLGVDLSEILNTIRG